MGLGELHIRPPPGSKGKGGEALTAGTQGHPPHTAAPSPPQPLHSAQRPPQNGRERAPRPAYEAERACDVTELQPIASSVYSEEGSYIFTREALAPGRCRSGFGWGAEPGRAPRPSPPRAAGSRAAVLRIYAEPCAGRKRPGAPSAARVLAARMSQRDTLVHLFAGGYVQPPPGGAAGTVPALARPRGRPGRAVHPALFLPRGLRRPSGAERGAVWWVQPCSSLRTCLCNPGSGSCGDFQRGSRPAAAWLGARPGAVTRWRRRGSAAAGELYRRCEGSLPLLRA